MDDQVTPALAQSSAARAFDDLRGEISLLRRAVEGLTAERRDQPDYSRTLEALATSNEEIRAWARKISERPALQLTPERIGEQIQAASSGFRQLDRHDLRLEQVCLENAVAELRAALRQTRTANEQLRQIKIVGGVCFLAGFMIGPLLAQVSIGWS
jgi:septation ring formation regulator EzrA